MTIALTFDDGPHPRNTPRILEILKSYDFKATFFLQGYLLNKYKNIGRMIVEHGHEIGNHTYEHIDIKKCPYNEFSKSVFKTEELINLFYKRSHIKLLRTPYGRINLKLLYYIIRHEYLWVGWSKDSLDSFIGNEENLIKFFQDCELTSGDIILFHEDYNHTVKALPKILYEIDKIGFRSVSINQLYGKSNKP